VPRLDEIISAQFARWEQRARGWRVWPEPVRPEPPFEEFTGYALSPAQPLQDDGRKPGLLASLFDQIEKKLNPAPPVIVDDVVEPEPLPVEEALDSEFAVSLPASLAIDDAVLRAFFDSLAVCSEPTCFEVFARNESVIFQFASCASDASSLRRQLRAFFPEIVFIERQNFLSDAWIETEGTSFVVDFGLANEFMLPLETDYRLDPLVGLVGALSSLRSDELAVFQVLFQPARHSWGNSIWRSVTDRSGKNLFLNQPQLITGTKQKVTASFFGVSVRAAAKAPEFDDAALILRNVAFALRAFTRLDGNRLIPLHNDEYGFEEHEEDLLRRVSRRGGMLLNREELAGFVHFPSDEVQSPKLGRQRVSAKAAPPCVTNTKGVLLGLNESAGKVSEVRLWSEQRVRHCHIIGASGTGKSTLLLQMIAQDIEAGEGVGILDPHGDLIDQIVARIPEDRIDDVVLLNPSDEEFPIGFNVLSSHSSLEKSLLASDLVSIFRRFSTSWGDQLNSVFANAVNAFLESERGGTLSDLRRFLLDARYREEFLESVRDPEIVFYWRKAFPQLGGNKSIGPVLTRLEMFLSPKPIRYMVSQKQNRLDFADILNSRKIFLAKLSQGQVGKENAFLLGSLLVSKFQQLAMGRQSLDARARSDFWFYLDEFQNFICPSMSEILTGARKYRVGLVLAHQELHQLQRDADVASAVIGNTGTRIVFRVGDADAQALAKGFASFESRDLQNLEVGQAVCRVERADFDFNLSVPIPPDVDRAHASAMCARVTTRSREKYASSRADVEAALARAVPDEPRAEKKRVAVERPAPTVFPAPTPTLVVTPVPPPETPAPEPKPVVAASAEESHEPGRGGAQHKTIQNRIKEAAQTLGFLAKAEGEVLDGKGSADLALKNSQRTIACEITVTTTVDHEFGNIVKCLKEGFSHVAMISTEPEKLEHIRRKVDGSVPKADAERVAYYSVDAFLEYLKRTADSDAAASKPPQQDLKRGYKVRRHGPDLSPAEAKQREDAAVKMIAEAIKRKTE